MCATAVYLTHVKLRKTVAKCSQNQIRFVHGWINLAAMAYVEAQARLRQPCEDVGKFPLRSSANIAFVHILDEQERPERIPKNNISDRVGVKNDPPSAGGNSTKQIDNRLLLFLLKFTWGVNGDVRVALKVQGVERVDKRRQFLLPECR